MESGAEREPSRSILDYDMFELAGLVFDEYPEPETLADFGPYQIRGRIDKGGMGEVWHAYDYIACREAAVKIPRYLSDASLRWRFAEEVSSLAKLEHPFIARLYDHGACPDGTPYFAMEFVDGKPLDEYCREKNLSLKERVRLFRAVCEAVQFAHGLLVVHRDLKPSNILVKEDGTPKLLDFGIAAKLKGADEPARQTQTEVGFTRAYAAPEQFRREPAGVYTDVYALGVILYQLLAGLPPYDLEHCTPGQAELIVTGESEPEKPSVVAKRAAGEARTGNRDWNDLDVLCLTAMKKEIKERYGTVLEFAQDIERYLRGEPLKARAEGLAYKAGKFARRNWKVLTAVSAVLLVVAGLSGFYAVRLASARDAALMQARRAERTERFMLGMFGGSGDAAPAEDLRVITVLDNAVREAGALNNEPGVQTSLWQTLGKIYENLGRFERADALLKASLTKRQAVFGGESAEAAESLVALSYLRIDQAQFADAERLAREAIAIDNAGGKSDDVARAKALTVLGSVMEHRGELEAGVKVLEEAVRLESTPAGDAAALEESLTFLSNCETLRGHTAVGYGLAQRVLEMDRQMYGDEHPNVAEDLGNLGQIEEQRGLYQQSERHYRQALAIFRKWYGADHVEAALNEEGLVKALVQEGKDDEAEAMLRHAIPIQERLMGKTHPWVGLGMSWLGAVELKRGKIERAEEDFRRMKEIWAAAYGEKNIHFADVASRFGELAVAKKDYGEAERLFGQAIQILSQSLSPDSLRAGIAKIGLGDVLVHERRYAEAEPLLAAGYKAVLRDSTTASTAAIEAQRDLAVTYRALNQPEKAAELRLR